MVSYHDPHIPKIGTTREHAELAGRESCPITDAFDLILIATNHREYHEMDFSHFKCPVVDTRNCVRQRPAKYYQA